AGTGFLTEDNIFVTNNHVLPDRGRVQVAIVEFNFETDDKGNLLPPVPCHLDDNKFATCADDDWSAVRIIEDINAFVGAIPISEIELKVGDFANIIQHPDGKPKQIALYHNVIVKVDSDQVQYLTDTLPGSSGSPVFVRDWKLGALHRGSVNVSLGWFLFG